MNPNQNLYILLLALSFFKTINMSTSKEEYSYIIWSQEITQSGDMGRKTPISFNFRKYVEKHCNAPW